MTASWPLVDGDLEQRRPIDEAAVTDAIDWIERIALAIARVTRRRGVTAWPAQADRRRTDPGVRGPDGHSGAPVYTVRRRR
ncbi:hypothetical protein [Streptomyces sp. NPDC058632]|uniref:hypothetical protein n=1 Tax=unclassified Streptomyces TaxID=2593676 RepID=UPI0036698855